MRPPTTLLLPLLAAALLIPSSAAAARVSVLRTHLEALRGMVATRPPEPPAPPPSMSHRVVTLTPTVMADGEAALLVAARWAVLGGETAWVDLVLAGPALLVQDVTVNGAPAPIFLAADGAHLVTRLVSESDVGWRFVIPERREGA